MNIKDNHLILVFMVIVTVGLFGLTLVLAFHSVPAENETILVGATGAFITVFSLVAQKVLGINTKPNDGTSPANGVTQNPTPPNQEKAS